MTANIGNKILNGVPLPHFSIQISIYEGQPNERNVLPGNLISNPQNKYRADFLQL